MSWQELGSMIAAFMPEQLIFLACQAGNISACETLFESIPSVQQVFASPVNIPKSQQHLITLKVSHTLSAKKESSTLVGIMQGINALATKQWMFSRTREEHEYGELRSKQLFEKGLLMITDWLK